PAASADGFSPQAWNRYAYVGNSPTSLMDRFGNNFCGQFQPFINASQCITEDFDKYHIYDASYTGSPYDPTAVLISITAGVGEKVCDISSCGYQFGQELAAGYNKYQTEINKVYCPEGDCS